VTTFLVASVFITRYSTVLVEIILILSAAEWLPVLVFCNICKTFIIPCQGYTEGLFEMEQFVCDFRLPCQVAAAE